MSNTSSNWAGVAFGLSLSFLAAYQLFKLPPVLPVLLETYGYDRTLAGGFMSVYAVAGLGLSVWLGRLLERRGIAGPVLAALLLMMAGNGLALLRPESGWLLLAARALEGAAFAVLAIAGPLLANRETSARQLPLVIGLTAAWIPAGQLTASLLAPLTLATLGWRGLWLAGAGLTLALILWTLARQRRHALVPVRRGRGVAVAPPPAPLDRRERIALWLVATIFMLWSGQYFAYMTWLPLYLVEATGLSVSMAVAGYLVPVVVLLAFNLLTGALLRAGVPLGPLLLLALASQAAVWWLQPAAAGLWSGLAALIGYGIGAGITPTCLFAMPSAVAGPGRAARAFGIVMTGRNLGVLIGPILLAQAFERTETWSVSGPIFGTLTLVAVALAAALALRLPARAG
ncbi:MAG: MFS transporter [Rhodospirillales bacterium]|nr:MFS transporter [Rhodospirillales bacterium]